MSNRDIIINAFKPNSHITDPVAFVGRKKQIKQLADALRSEGSCPVIYGDRGLGKTSLGKQLHLIAEGNNAIFQHLNLTGYALPLSDVFCVVWVDCSDSIENSDQLLQRIINRLEQITRDTDASYEMTSHMQTASIDLKVLKLEDRQTTERKRHQGFTRLNLEDQLSSALNSARKRTGRRILIIIDELDRMKNTAGLAGLIKNTSSTDVKFTLIGIAHNISALLADHVSLERNVRGVQIDPMLDEELNDIIANAEKVLREKGTTISFEKEAKTRLVSAAGGYPWFIHVLGQDALVRAWDSGSPAVLFDHVEHSIMGLPVNTFAQHFSDIYRSSVRDSYPREMVLRLLAKWSDDDIPLSEIYPLCKKLGVSNPSESKRNLLKRDYGEVLLVPPNHKRGIVRFRNNMFKRYVDLRPSIYANAQSEVNEMWRRRHPSSGG